MANKQTINVKDFLLESYESYEKSLKIAKPDAGKPMIVKSNTTKENAIKTVENILNGTTKDSKKFNANLLKILNKKNVKPTVKKVYQTVMLTFFRTLQVEYDYNYYLNGNNINMSPKTININEGYAEFTGATPCFTGSDYAWKSLTQDRLTDDFEPDYKFVNVTENDVKKDSKESMRQYNEELKSWVKDFQQKELGTARVLDNVHIYNKEYDYDEGILLVPYLLVSYDLGDMIVTFPVNGLNGESDSILVNNPIAKFPKLEGSLPPSFSVVLFILLSFAFVIVGGIAYLLWYTSKKLTYKSKSLKDYSLEELRKLL